MFESQVELAPAKLAVQDSELSLRYLELSRRVDVLETTLHAVSGTALSDDCPVAIFSISGFRRLVAMLAALKLGIPFAYISGGLALTNVFELLDHSNVPVVVTDRPRRSAQPKQLYRKESGRRHRPTCIERRQNGQKVWRLTRLHLLHIRFDGKTKDQ
jgi:acyl-coenzyme A synthetase/AMP-(fatty) acid ligase